MLALLLGPVVSLLVTLLKKVGWVSDHPKTAAAIVSAVATVVTAVCGATACHVAADALNQLATSVGNIVASHPVLAAVASVAVTTGGAVATHEIVTKPLTPKNPLQN